MKSKQCLECKETKPLLEFYKVSETLFKKSPKLYSQNIDYYCKYCRNGNSLKSHWNKSKKPCSIEDCERPHYAKTYCRVHYARLIRNGTTDALWTPLKNDETRSYSSRVTINHPNGNTYEYDRLRHHNRKNYLKHKWNLDIVDFDRMSKDGCQICGEVPEVNYHVDHDHACCPGNGSCGKCVRGVVCARCNTLVAKYERGKLRPDNPRLKKIIKYLQKYAKRRAKIDS